MKILVLGAGNIGRACAWYLTKLQNQVHVVDKSEEAIRIAKQTVDTLEDPIFFHNLDYKKWTDFLENVSVVLSCLPYFENIEIAKHCIDHNIPYVDLGGRVDVEEQIRLFHKEKGGESTIALSQGLAPGYINILLHKALKLFPNPPKDVTMAVGGLPTDINPYEDLGIFKYTCTWSFAGLINEYRDKCKVISNGEVLDFPGLTPHNDWWFNANKACNKFEMFHTSGGSSNSIDEMLRLGVPNFRYCTIRYKGHREKMDMLLNHSNLDDDKIIEILKKNCPKQPDFVLTYLNLDAENGLRYNKVNFIDCDTKFTAMQRATAIPICAVTHLVANNELCGPINYKQIAENENFWNLTKEIGL